MKLILLLAVLLAALPLGGCNLLDTRQYINGPNGGCYYNNDSGNKVYVDHRYCQ